MFRWVLRSSCAMCCMKWSIIKFTQMSSEHVGSVFHGPTCQFAHPLGCSCRLRQTSAWTTENHPTETSRMGVFDLLTVHIGLHIARFNLDLYAWTQNDVIIWKRFPHYWHFARGIHGSPVDFLHKWPAVRFVWFVVSLIKLLYKQSNCR